VQPQPEEVDDALAEELGEDDPPLPVWAANVENWIVERALPHFGHAAVEFFAVTMRS